MKYPPYEKSHIVALIGTVISIVVLIITVYCVWYPYLLTANFIPARCVPYRYEARGPFTCKQQSSSTCTDLPSFSEVIGYFNFTPGSTTSTATSATATAATSSYATTSVGTTTNSTASSENMKWWQSKLSSLSLFDHLRTSASATAPTSSYATTSVGTTTNSTENMKWWQSKLSNLSIFDHLLINDSRKRYLEDENVLSWALTPPPGGTYCTSFPCILVTVNFLTTYGLPIRSSGYLFSSYDQLVSYPQCTYSSCGSSNQANYKSVQAQCDSFSDTDQFQCYVNVFVRPFLVLEQVNFSYAAAVNSILWPIMALIFFGVCLIALRCHAFHRYNSTRPANTLDTREEPYSVHYVDMQSPGVTSFTPPSLPNDIATSGVAMGFPTTNEKNPAMFLDGVTAVDPASPAQWAFGYPPKYEEAGYTVGDGAFEMPSNAASADWTFAADGGGASAIVDSSEAENTYKY